MLLLYNKTKPVSSLRKKQDIFIKLMTFALDFYGKIGYTEKVYIFVLWKRLF